jgi:hypothetical protein
MSAPSEADVGNIACFVSFTEKPDVGNPQARFCEGH